MIVQPNQQHAPAAALAALLNQHPELPELFWTIIPGGFLSGSLHDDTTDVRRMALAYRRVLGGEPREMWRAAREDEAGTERYSVSLEGAWLGVRFYLSLGCDVAALTLGTPARGVAA